MHWMPGESQTGCRCAEWRQPASEQRDEQHRRQTVPERVHDMEPTRPATEQRPVERVAQDRDRPVESGAGLARPVGVVEGREPGADRMRSWVRDDDGTIVLHKAVTDRWEIQGHRGNEGEEQSAFHRGRG